MALQVNHLNGDSTFLLTFAPSEADAARPAGVGTFSVLVDPWLSGESTIFHRKFALAKHTIPCAIQHLSEIPTPNAVVISQDRTDHCHEATLKQLDPQLPNTVIFAHPAAARRIRGWKYFKPSKVVALPTFVDRKLETVIRFRIPSGNPDLQPGEVTIAFIPSKFDITGTHNAIGITYRAPSLTQEGGTSDHAPASWKLKEQGSPSHLRSSAPSSGLMPPTPPDSPTLSLHGEPTFPHRELGTGWKEHTSQLRARSYGALRVTAAAQADFSMSATDLTAPTRAAPPVPLMARSTGSISPDRCVPRSPAASLNSTTSSLTLSRRPRAASVIYAPHGCSYAAIRNYASSHLLKQAGLPLTLLLHSFDRVTNAWYLGGNIISGMPGGVEIARNLLAQTWISAHDEDKESSGVAVVKCVVDKYSPEEVRRLLETAEPAPMSKGQRKASTSSVDTGRLRLITSKRNSKSMLTDVRQMACGEVAVLAIA